MIKTDEAIASYYALRPTNFHDLERLEVRQNAFDGAWETVIEIELRPKDTADSRRLVLSFKGVRNLKYIPASLSVLCFSFLEIVSAQDRQWEGVNYHVFESEQDTDFSFLCREFRASICAAYG